MSRRWSSRPTSTQHWVDLCDLAERRTRWPLGGRSLRGLMNGTQATVREVAISTWGDVVSVRTPGFRLIARERDGQVRDLELYDMSVSADPLENIAADQGVRTTAMLEQLNRR